ncbi:MAG: hypothetical protein AVDCRST_MAG93-4621 [uncultured Chloroflexia bacterium]|uniref:Uncharacterized protein n=1 Tax=uncultured Chloroflexia bacterium TaxID=1672391 RepID=A0A6J4KBW5_9CHLR|nr:MAG: hypothetical protein AVDCRST_MAG93-4621 [uncultured Chloroflexia bacterium]
MRCTDSLRQALLAEHPATCSDGPQRPVAFTAMTCTSAPTRFLAG